MSNKARERNAGPFDTETILSPELRTSSMIAALAVSPTGATLDANDFLLKLVGWPMSSLAGVDIRSSLLARPSDWQWWEAADRGRHVSDAEILLKTSDGRTVLLRGDIRAMRQRAGDRRWLSGLFVDTTGAKQLERTLSHAARTEAVASLTSGIAHDFSNLLTVLVGNLYLIGEGVRDNAPLHEKAKLARDAAKRGVDLIRQLLAFARNEKIEPAGVDPKKSIANLEPLLRHALGARIALETRIAPEVSLIDANAAQLESAIVNLAINARDAIEGTGTVRITAANVAVDERHSGWSLPAGEYVRISVSDDGMGIPEKLLGRVFEPFFSTKGSGKGTGLGLAMVRQFAVDAGGTVLLKSEPGKGTTVSLLLPRSAQTTAATTVSTMPLSTLPGGKETILVFAQDEEIRQTVEPILKALGYRVIVNNEWRDALTVARTAAAHLFLIDVKSAADTTAHRLIEAIRHLKPPVRAVVVRDSASIGHSGIVTLLKPFDLSGLATAVRDALDGEGGEQ